MTTLNDRPTEVGGPKHFVNGKWFLMIAAAVLAVVLVGLGSRVIGEDTSSRDGEIDELLDNYLEAWEAKDEAAVRSATTGDFVLNEFAYTHDLEGEVELYYRIDDDIDGLVSEGFGYDWSVEHVGDSTVTGEGPWFVSVEETWKQTLFNYEGQANYTIVEVDGELKIANHYWAGLRIYRAE